MKTLTLLLIAALACPASADDSADAEARAYIAIAKAKANAQHVSTPIAEKAVPIPADGQLSPRGQWRWNRAAWAWQPVKSVTIPAQGHWVTERVCGRNGCRNVRRWVQDSPARTIRVEGTSLPAKRLQPEYPRQPLGKRWTFNGGNITAKHLANPRGHHRHERLSYAWLMTQDQQQLNAIGSDSHNHELRGQYVVRD